MNSPNQALQRTAPGGGGSPAIGACFRPARSLNLGTVAHMSATRLLEHRIHVTAYGNDLFQACGIEFAKTTEMQRQVSGAFLFGVAYAHGWVHQLAPSDVHALVITILMDVLHYSAEQAGAFSSQLVRATSAGPNDTMNAIIHRGIDGHRQLTSGEHNALRQNLLGIFQTLGQPYVG